MSQKILIDVSVCLDVLLDRKPFVTFSGQIFEEAEKGNIRVYISGLSFDTLFYIMRPVIGTAKSTQKLKKLLDHLKVGTVDKETVTRALQAGWTDLENALQYYCAVQAGCVYLITRNKKDFKTDSTNMKVLTPQVYIEEFL